MQQERQGGKQKTNTSETYIKSPNSRDPPTTAAPQPRHPALTRATLLWWQSLCPLPHLGKTVQCTVLTLWEVKCEEGIARPMFDDPRTWGLLGQRNFTTSMVLSTSNFVFGPSFYFRNHLFNKYYACLPCVRHKLAVASHLHFLSCLPSLLSASLLC